MGKPVLVLGEALVDIVERGRQRSEHVGGSPLNVACGLARLGHGTRFGGWWGTDEYGRAIETHAEAHGVELLPGCAAAARTSTALARLDAAGHADYEFDLDWQLPPLPGLDDVQHLHTGSIATTLPPGADTVLAAARAVAGRGSFSYDPNCRPAIMGGPAAVLDRVGGLVGLADLVKASDEDLAWLFPGEPVESVVQRWLETGAGLVVITRGASGASGWLPAAGRLDFAAPPSQVVDTVGAGDSFMAGLISGLLDAQLLGVGPGRLRRSAWRPVAPAIERALAAAAITVARPGAYSPSRAEVDARMG